MFDRHWPLWHWQPSLHEHCSCSTHTVVILLPSCHNSVICSPPIGYRLIALCAARVTQVCTENQQFTINHNTADKATCWAAFWFWVLTYWSLSGTTSVLPAQQVSQNWVCQFPNSLIGHTVSLSYHSIHTNSPGWSSSLAEPETTINKPRIKYFWPDPFSNIAMNSKLPPDPLSSIQHVSLWYY